MPLEALWNLLRLIARAGLYIIPKIFPPPEHAQGDPHEDGNRWPNGQHQAR